MKKKLFFVLMLAMCGLGTLSAQNTAEVSSFEGEMTSRLHNVTRFKSQTLTKNILAKMILKSIMKKFVDNSPVNYTGTYEAVTIGKGNKIRVHSSYNNSVMISVKDNGKLTMTIYYPYIKKGYTTVSDLEAVEKQNEAMQKGDPEKTGATIDILGHTCEVYKIMSEQVTDTLDSKSVMKVHQEFAMCDEPGLPPADKEYVKGVKGVPLKYTINTVAQISNKMVNIDYVMSIASMMTSFNMRSVDDSEFDIPSDVKIYETAKDAKIVAKINEENRKYMEKKGLWKEENPEESKIYDNLTEEWDY
ncbi:MAG: hypothetical protein IJV10_00890 [Prevotella sp.]|nr:hypothetical protein [Prevotella sp.]